MQSTSAMVDEAELREQYSDRIYQFGSTNSNDVDYFVDIPFEPEETKEFRVKIIKIGNSLKRIFSAASNHALRENEIDIQFIKIKNGVVVWCENKDVEETNNCILDTFFNHKFNALNYGDSCPVTMRLKQSVTFKAIKVLRSTLTLLSRTACREEVKTLLKEGTFTERLDYLQRLTDEGKFSSIQDFSKRQPVKEVYKDLAFYYAQLYALMNGETVFTKFGVCVRYADIAPYIMRQDLQGGEALEKFISEVLGHLLESIKYESTKDHIKFEGEEHYYDNKTEQRID